VLSTNYSVDIKLKAPSVGESVLMGLANGLGGGCGCFGSLTGLGGYGMYGGSLSSSIGGILCGTAMNIAYGGYGMGYGGLGMGMYGMGGFGMGMCGFGGYSSSLAMANVGSQLGASLANIGVYVFDKLTTRYSTSGSSQSDATSDIDRQIAAKEATLNNFETHFDKDHPEYKNSINEIQKKIEKLDSLTTSIANKDTQISGLKEECKNLENSNDDLERKKINTANLAGDELTQATKTNADIDAQIAANNKLKNEKEAAINKAEEEKRELNSQISALGTKESLNQQKLEAENKRKEAIEDSKKKLIAEIDALKQQKTSPTTPSTPTTNQQLKALAKENKQGTTRSSGTVTAQKDKNGLRTEFLNAYKAYLNSKTPENKKAVNDAYWALKEKHWSSSYIKALKEEVCGDAKNGATTFS